MSGGLYSHGRGWGSGLYLSVQRVGRHLALAARHVVYGLDLVYPGPVYQSMSVQGDTIRLNFGQGSPPYLSVLMSPK